MESLSRPAQCPRCHAAFECKANDIQNCECTSITLNDAERAFIARHYKECLCAKCMAEMKAEYHNKF